MKRVFLFLFLVSHFYSSAQNGPAGIVNITKDSLKGTTPVSFRLTKNWRFHKGDSLVFAETRYNDSNWQIRDVMEKTDTGYKGGVDWYRLHVNIDTSAAGLPLAIGLMGKGAFEIYIDGKKAEEYGHIDGKYSSYVCSIFQPPLIVVIPSTGEHVLAVRYAAYTTHSIFKEEDAHKAGFLMTMGEANNYQQLLHRVSMVLTAALSFLLGIFLVLGVIHLLLFLYYTSIRSNLYFSIFCFAVSSLTLLSYLTIFSNDPALVVTLPNVGMPLSIAVGYFSFSGINNELFSRKKIRFYIIAGASILCCLAELFSEDAAGVLFIVTGIAVFLEALVLPIIGIYRKVKGARIVGVGILFSVAFIIFTVVFALISFMEDGKRTISINNILFAILGISAIFSIPFSMSVYLSWNFAQTNKALKKNLQQVQILSDQTLEQEREKKQILEDQNEKLEQEVTLRTEKIEKQHEELKKEKKKSDDLLLNILPEEVAEELKQKGHSDARHFDDVTVLFTDFVDFTTAGETMSPGELVNELNVCFKAFDEIMLRYDIEKIKTIGDAYMAVCGLPVPQAEHAVRTVSAALEIIRFMKERKQELKDKTFDVRIGIHSGNVVAGIVGVKKFAYDIWGDTVNTAARMEQNSAAGKINISQATYELVRQKFNCTYRGEIAAKGKGDLKMYFVE